MKNKSSNAKSLNDKSSPRVAIVHDWLVGGGAEKVVLELHRMYPDAPIYTSYATPEWQTKLDNKVVTGYLQRWPFGKLRKFLPLLRQWWFARLDLSQFDLVISSSGNGEAKFVRVNNPLSANYNLQSTKQTHICYCHTPPHFYWRKYQEYLDKPGFRPYWLARLGLKLLVKPLRRRDYAAAQRVDQFIANSTHIQADIKRYYGKDSVVIHPPVDTERFANPPTTYHLPSTTNPRSGFVTVGRQTPYKRTDIIVQACTQLGLPLTVVGNGPENTRLRQLAGDTVTFDTTATDEAVTDYLTNAEAFLFAAEEDFGITPVEAMAAGTPVIAYQAGGALDYVTAGKTGEFFNQQTVQSLVEVLQNFKPQDFDPNVIKNHAKQFSTKNFHKNLRIYTDSVMSNQR